VRILQYEPNRVVLTLEPQQDHAAAVLETHDHRQGLVQMRKPAPIQMNGLALKSDGLCTSKDLSGRNFTVRQDVVVDELRHRQVKATVLSDDDQGAKAGRSRSRSPSYGYWSDCVVAGAAHDSQHLRSMQRPLSMGHNKQNFNHGAGLLRLR